MTPNINLGYDSERFNKEYRQMIRNTGELVENFNTIVAMKKSYATNETARLYDREILDRLDLMSPVFKNGTISQATGSDRIQVNLQRILADCPLNTEILDRARELKRENPNYRFTVLVGEMNFTGKGNSTLTRIVTVNDGDEISGFISSEGGYLRPEQMPVIADPIIRTLEISENPIRARLSGRSGLLDKLSSHGY